MCAVDLCEDPRVLAAALALVDDYYDPVETPIDTSGSSATAVETRTSAVSYLYSPQLPQGCRGLSQRHPQLHHPVQKNRRTETVRGQARRWSKVVREQLRARVPMRTPSAMILAVHPLDCQRILTNLRSQLSTLAEIARVSRMTAPQGLSSTFVDISTRLKPTGGSLLAQVQTSFYLPFKLSHVVEAAWEDLVARALGTPSEHQLAFVAHHEGFSVSSSIHPSPSTTTVVSGTAAVRRVYQADGSVLFLFSSVFVPQPHPPPPPVNDDLSTHGDPFRSSKDPLAGCLMKAAGWVRLRRVSPPTSDCLRSTRHLVIVEMAQSDVVTSSSANHVVPIEQLQCIREQMLAADPPNMRLALENRLMDLSLASAK